MKAQRIIPLRPWTKRRSQDESSKPPVSLERMVRQTQAMMAIRRKLDGKETNDERAT